MAEKILQENYTKYEVARIIGARALQISGGAPFLVKLTDKELETMRFNPIEVAKKEFAAGVIPITVKRPMPTVLMEEAKAEAKQ
ncbi:DNA-directed RNA polymerase subunit K [Candidatus Woesearchaeota archaeon]|nr:DNA-directed RNA polymerase subunit K [Candidatus Woesearchaeota archaeon]